eukprot:246081_1
MLIESLQKENIKYIQCANRHSLAITSNNNYYMWGLNDSNQCIRSDQPVIYNPLLLNSYIKKYQIKNISLGYNNTKLILTETYFSVSLWCIVCVFTVLLAAFVQFTYGSS